MSATGWAIRHDDSAPSDPWIASNLDHCATVFGRDRAEVSSEIAAYETRRWADARANSQMGLR